MEVHKKRESRVKTIERRHGSRAACSSELSKLKHGEVSVEVTITVKATAMHGLTVESLVINCPALGHRPESKAGIAAAIRGWPWVYTNVGHTEAV
jgi:hypothetical protein